MVTPTAKRDPFGAALRVGAAAHAAPLDGVAELGTTGAQLVGAMLAEPAFVAAAAAALEQHVAARGVASSGDAISFSYTGVRLKLTTSAEAGELHLAFQRGDAPDGFANDLAESRTTLRELAAAVLSGNFDFSAAADALVALLAAPTLRSDERERLLARWSAALDQDEAAKTAVAATALRIASPAPGALLLTCTIPSLKPPEPPRVRVRTTVEITPHNAPTDAFGPTVTLYRGRTYLLSAYLVETFARPGTRWAFRYRLSGLRLAQRAEEGNECEEAPHARHSALEGNRDESTLRCLVAVAKDGPLTVELFGTGAARVEIRDVTDEPWVTQRRWR